MERIESYEHLESTVSEQGMNNTTLETMLKGRQVDGILTNVIRGKNMSLQV